MRGSDAAQQGHPGDGGVKQGITTSQNKRRSAAPDAQPLGLCNLVGVISLSFLKIAE
jgi:hypothetical protein